MRIKQQELKDQFSKAEENFNYCWDLLVDLKESNIKDNDFAIRIISFQDKLVETIFALHKTRERIIAEEKLTIYNKSSYNFQWFEKRLKLLSIYKKGIDQVVNIGKALGDAYAYFFYQNDLHLLEEHLSHQKIVNSAAGIGERGEMEFLKQKKHIDGRLTLYHGITNILRYGDFSFVDLKAHKIIELGELKTKLLDENSIQLSLTLLRHNRIKISEKTTLLSKEDFSDSRKGRQMMGLIKFIENTQKKNDDISVRLQNKYYFEEINNLFKETRVNRTKTVQVSPGLAFAASRFSKSSLFKKIFFRDPSPVISKDENGIPDTVKRLMKTNSTANSIVVGQLLYNPDFADKNTPGTVPLFWYPLNLSLLRKLYFIESYIFSFFNPIHLIEEIQDLGFWVDSKYSNKKKATTEKSGIERFDLFVSYIVNFLQTESFVLDTINEIQKFPFDKKARKVLVKPQQHFQTHHGKPSS